METQEKVMIAGSLMAYTGTTARQIQESTDLAYNTILGYRRGSGARYDLPTLTKVAQALGVEVFELFYQGQYGRPLVKIAQALGLDVTTPITGQEYRSLFTQIGQALGVVIEPADFSPLDDYSRGENYE